MENISLNSVYKFLQENLSLSENLEWIVQVFVVVFLTLIASFVAMRFLTSLHKKLQHTKTPWDDALIDALRKPVRVGIWVVGLSYATEMVYIEADATILAGVPVLRDVAIVALLGWFMLRFVRHAEANYIAHKERKGEKYDLTTVGAVSKLLRLSVMITTSLVVLQTLGISVSGVLAFGGIGGMAVGFAAKDLLANFFGALTVHLDKPFRVGDWVRSPDREIEGTVEEIGWRQTRIRTFDKRPLYVPNSVFSTIVIENPSRMSHRRINETFGVRYDDMAKVAPITQAVKEMLVGHPEIDESQTLMVHLNEFSASSADFFIYTFTHTTDWVKFHGIKQDVMLKIAAIIEENGAEFAFPTTTVHLPEAEILAGEAA